MWLWPSNVWLRSQNALFEDFSSASLTEYSIVVIEGYLPSVNLKQLYVKDFLVLLYCFFDLKQCFRFSFYPFMNFGFKFSFYIVGFGVCALIILLHGLKSLKLSGNVYNILFNLNKFMASGTSRLIFNLAASWHHEQKHERENPTRVEWDCLLIENIQGFQWEKMLKMHLMEVLRFGMSCH